MGKKEWLREIYRRRGARRPTEGRMNRGETCRRPQRRIRPTNYLLLHYKGCQPGCLCQLSYILMPVSGAHTLIHRLPRMLLTERTYSLRSLQCFLKSVKHVRTHASPLHLLLTGDEGACHHRDADSCCRNVTATPQRVRRK